MSFALLFLSSKHLPPKWFSPSPSVQFKYIVHFYCCQHHYLCIFTILTSSYYTTYIAFYIDTIPIFKTTRQFKHFCITSDSKNLYQLSIVVCKLSEKNIKKEESSRFLFSAVLLFSFNFVASVKHNLFPNFFVHC